jgi:WD40 repeat protein
LCDSHPSPTPNPFDNKSKKTTTKKDDGQDQVYGVAGNKDMIVVGSQDASIRVYDWGGTLIRTLNGHRRTVRSVALDEASLIISGSWDKDVRLWDLA